MVLGNDDQRSGIDGDGVCQPARQVIVIGLPVLVLDRDWMFVARRCEDVE